MNWWEKEKDASCGAVCLEKSAKECSAMARSELEGCKWETVCRSNCLSLPFYLVLNASHSDLVWPPGAHAVVFVMASRVIFFFIPYMKSTVRVLLLVKLSPAIWHISFPVSEKALHLACCCTQPFLYGTLGKTTDLCSFSLYLSGSQWQQTAAAKLNCFFTQFSKILYYINLHTSFIPVLYYSQEPRYAKINSSAQIYLMNTVQLFKY